MGKPRLNLRLRPDLLARLEAETRRPGVTKNAVIEKALGEHRPPPEFAQIGCQVVANVKGGSVPVRQCSDR